MTLRPTRRAVLSGAALLLAGCAEVPSTGAVTQAEDPHQASGPLSLLLMAHRLTLSWAVSCRP